MSCTYTGEKKGRVEPLRFSRPATLQVLLDEAGAEVNVELHQRRIPNRLEAMNLAGLDDKDVSRAGPRRSLGAAPAFDLIEVAHFALRKIVEKEIDRSNSTVPGDDKIGSRVSWWFAGSPRYPSNPPGIT